MQEYIIDKYLRRILSKITTENGAISNQTVTFNSAAVFELTVPEQARYALCLLEEVGSSGSPKVIRYFLDGSVPTALVGIVRGDMDAFDIAGYSNLKNFKAIKVGGGSHTLTVQYFS